LKKEFAMRLKHIGIAALVAAGALAAGSAWAQASRIEVFGQAARDSRFDVYSDGARSGRFDTYTEGARSSRFDPYTEGMRSDPAGRAREGGGTVYGYPVPN
jgi:hypothetical protein